ncbi:MAG: ABC transporter permease, partial [Myxococcota bacterium]
MPEIPWRYLASRIGRAALTVLGVVFLVFLMVRLIPGDPAQAILGDQASPEDLAALRDTLHLDDPFFVQLTAFLGDLLDGSLGRSFRSDEVVADQIGEVFPSTLLLAIASLLVAWSLAIPLGTFAAAQHGTVWDKLASAVAIAGLAIPTIWLGPLLILGFGVELRWLPLPGDDQAGWEDLILPAITIGTAMAAIITRQTRGSMLEALRQPFVLVAKAKGLRPTRVFVKHALRNALLPVMTVAAAQVGALLTGTVVTEKIFERQGLGT